MAAKKKVGTRAKAPARESAPPKPRKRTGPTFTATRTRALLWDEDSDRKLIANMVVAWMDPQHVDEATEKLAKAVKEFRLGQQIQNSWRVSDELDDLKVIVHHADALYKAVQRVPPGAEAEFDLALSSVWGLSFHAWNEHLGQQLVRLSAMAKKLRAEWLPLKKRSPPRTVFARNQFIRSVAQIYEQYATPKRNHSSSTFLQDRNGLQLFRISVAERQIRSILSGG